MGWEGKEMNERGRRERERRRENNLILITLFLAPA